jgi:alpha-beta hydrolase superfamily lysophospholipase
MTVSTTIRYDAPAELRTRGRILVVPGRGESQAAYVRLATRLAADSYHVRVLAPPAIDPADVAGAVARLARAVLREAEAGPDGGDRPLILIGADTGALAIAAVLAQGALAQGALTGRPPQPGAVAPAGLPDAVVPAGLPDAVVLAGLPGRGRQHTGDWAGELDARTQCSAHRGVLGGDAQVQRGRLATAVPDELIDLAFTDRAAARHLVLIGDLDPLADREEVAQYVKALPAGQLAVVAGARHDVLNDLPHRSVAAAIVGFLERLRGSAAFEPVIRAEYSAW